MLHFTTIPNIALLSRGRTHDAVVG